MEDPLPGATAREGMGLQVGAKTEWAWTPGRWNDCRDSCRTGVIRTCRQERGNGQAVGDLRAPGTPHPTAPNTSSMS